MSLLLRVQQKESSGGNIMLMLSLKLILLAFFILLTTMSEFEERRTRDVMESVTSTFLGQVPAIRGLPNPSAGTGALSGANSLTVQLKTLFKQTIPAVEVNESADGKVLRIEMASRSLFERGSTALSPGRSAFLRRLAEALTSGQSQKRFFELQFLHAYPAAAAIGENSLAVLRGGALTRRLIARNVAADKLSTGLWPVPARGDDIGKVSIAIHLFPEEQQQGAVTQRPAEDAQ
jgi:hypothetical protein